ncbi:Dolichyl-diphosphooligosaccharide--protein glycosyltransferase subunit WBP1 [Chytridium lagenaria]|nr:Dolichyl-diphosphooligosaccharide--protein glycosyltransferase subunit WBP1 [Chytridium lagenaria]
MASSTTFLALIVTVACLLCMHASFVLARSSAGTRTLVVLNSLEDETKYSAFLNGLRARGFELLISPATEKNVLVKYEEKLFDHLLVLAHSAGCDSWWYHPQTILDFQDRGGNVLLTGSSTISETLRDIAIEYSVEIDEKGFAVQDDFSHTSADPTLVVTDRIVAPSSIVSSVKKPIVYRGNGARLTGRNKHIVPLLTGTATSYSWMAGSKKPVDKVCVGEEWRLLDPLTGNLDFITEVSKWVFQEKGVLKVTSTFHHRENEDQQHGAYRIKDDLVYRIEISEYHETAWRPFTAPDVQFEAVMLDPYIRANLTQVPTTTTSGIFEVHFRSPRRVDYRRYGYSWIIQKETVAVQPFRHDGYPRFLTPAFPYYVNAFSMVVAFFALSVVVLYYAPKEVTDAIKKGAKKEKTA